MPPASNAGEYSLATGEAAVRRLTALHKVQSPAGRRVLLRAGLQPGMTVADLGCGVGATTHMLAEMVGPTGRVTGVDLSAAQVEQGRRLCLAEGFTNATFVVASATDTGLPRNSFDLVYCRYLLLHLIDPAACLQEMLGILKPGGILVVEDGDLAAGGSSPASSLNWFGDLFNRLGPTRSLNYSVANDLFHMFKAVGCPDPDIEMYHVTIPRGEERYLLKWSVEEAAPGFVGAGLVTAAEMETILADMERDTQNHDILVLGPRVSLVWGRKLDS